MKMKNDQVDKVLRKRLKERDTIRRKWETLEFQYQHGVIDGEKYATEKSKLSQRIGETLGMIDALKMVGYDFQ